MDLTTAQHALGGEVVTGCSAMSGGQLKKRAGLAALGGLAAVAINNRLQTDKTDENAPGDHVGSIYVALGTDRVAFLEQKNGLTSSLGRHLATHELGDFTAVEWKPAKFGISRLALTTAEGQTYKFDVALAQKGNAQRIADAVRERGRLAA
jgi:hypothetical protein